MDLTRATNAGMNAGIMRAASDRLDHQTLWLGDELVSFAGQGNGARYPGVTARSASEFGALDRGAVSLGQRPRRLRSNIERGGTDEAVVRGLLSDRRGPSNRPARRECRSEHVGWYADAVHHHAGVELDVGVEAASGFQLVEHAQRSLLDLDGELGLRTTELSRHLAQERRARVVGLIDTMPESHEALTG